MLTSLDFLNPGMEFPPKDEKKRLDMYHANRELFEGEHVEVYADALKRIDRVLGLFNTVISYPIPINFQKKMSLKIVDLLFGEPPSFIGEEKEQVTIDNIERTSKLLNICGKVGIDVSRFGDGLFHVYKRKDRGVISMTRPEIWFPVVAPEDVQDITHHVLAWKEGLGDLQVLKIRIHTPGFVEYREHVLENGFIGPSRKPAVKEATGLNDFAIIQVSNVTTSDRCTGIDDYSDIDGIIADIMVRIGQIDRILDKHADPSMKGPKSALEEDGETGQWRVKAGSFFIVEPGDEAPGYLTWEGQLNANFKQVELLLNLLYTISEMGSAIFGDLSAKAGAIPSGSALRRLMVSPLAKVQRVRMRFDEAIKQAFVLCSQLGGEGVTPLKKPVGINWQDGLPGDPVEEATIITQRVGGKASMSIHRALTTFDGMSENQADEEEARIQDEEASSSPLLAPPLSTHPESTPDMPEPPAIDPEA